MKLLPALMRDIKGIPVTVSGLADLFILMVIMALLVFTPLPIGSVKPGSVLVIELLCFTGFIVWLLKCAREAEAPFTGLREYSPLLLFTAVCLFQVVPLPGPVLGAVSPASLQVWERSGAALSELGAGAEGGFHTVSLYPGATVRETLFLLSCIAFAVVVSRSLRSGRRLRAVLVPVFALLFFEAALGIYQYLGSGGSEDASGTFVNRNHFAGYLEMSFPLALGYALSLGGWRRGRRRFFPGALAASESSQKQFLLVFLLGVVLLAVIFSKSRMGIFSAALSLFFFTVLAGRFLSKGIGVKWMFYTVLTVALFFGLYIGLYPVIERYMLLEENLPSRTLLWRDIINIISDFPVLGTGFGTFGYVYPLYKLSIEKPLVYLYTHNDYLQILSETGFAGFLTLMAALVLFVRSSLGTLVRLSSEKDYGRFFIFLGIMTGIFSILVHSLADFNLQIPSNALYFAFLIGLSRAVGSGAGNDGHDKSV